MYNDRVDVKSFNAKDNYGPRNSLVSKQFTGLLAIQARYDNLLSFPLLYGRHDIIWL
jgi:hypothetical protein